MGPQQLDGEVVGEVNVGCRDAGILHYVTFYGGAGHIPTRVRLEKAYIGLLVIGCQIKLVSIIRP